LEAEENTGSGDLDLFEMADPTIEAAQIINDFYNKYNLSPNF